jgi:hypothetical protein
LLIENLATGYDQSIEPPGLLHKGGRETAFPPSWRWRIMRRGKPMGVRIEGGGFSTYDAARLAGKLVLANFLEQLELENSRIDLDPSKRGI